MSRPVKSIVNVYKDTEYWQKSPPGIGDYLRGCAYLVHRARHGEFAGLFLPRFNLDLAPAGACLTYPVVYHKAAREALVDAQEYFLTRRDGDVEQAIRDFLRSDAETLYISTNQSWRGTDDAPERDILDQVFQIFSFTEEFSALVDERLAPLPRGYVLLHVRDCNRDAFDEPETDDEVAYRSRAQTFIEGKLADRSVPNGSVVCISNNRRLRDLLCARYGFYNPGTAVENPGSKGRLSRAELLDLALLANAKALFALSYYPWSSGFSVWTARLFGVPASFFNSKSEF
jgi:hypothetical protein